MFLKIKISLVLLVLTFTVAFTQTNDGIFEEQEQELKQLFDSAFAFDSTKYYKSDIEKKELNTQIIEIFDEILEDENSFKYPFDSLKNIGIRFSDDKLLKIYTWNLIFTDGTYKYFGYIQYLLKSKKKIKTFKLIDKSDEISEPLNVYLKDTNWYGCLYYKILQNKYAGKKYYTLFGWDGNSYLTTKKIIEILTFSKSGKPKFGKSVFKVEKVRSKRLIFEFSNKAVMSLSYDKRLKMIIYDYLSPSKPVQKGQYQYYGPDGSYDGLRFSNGKWIHYSNIDIIKLKNSNYRAGKPKKGMYQPKRIY